MPSFTNTLVGVGPICDAACTVVFTKQDVTVLSPDGKVIIICWGGTHCEAVGRTAPHRKNVCYFYPRKMTDQKEWAQKLMDKKGVTCKDNE